MSPAINPRHQLNNYYDFVIVTKSISNLFNNRRRLVLIYHPYDGNLVVRYLLALPGDWIKKRNDEGIYINIPSGHIWVESLSGEDDSNSWGFV